MVGTYFTLKVGSIAQSEVQIHYCTILMGQDMSKSKLNIRFLKFLCWIIHTKITEKLKEIPENKKILLEARLEKERRIDLDEARDIIWKKWRHNKGKKTLFPKLLKRDEENLNEKLRKIEEEVEKYKDEIEKEKKEKESRLKRKEKK